MTRQPYTSRALLTPIVATVVLAVLAAATTARAQSPEAGRQLDFAKAELADQDWDGALASSTSALRLNPELYEAMLIKGLAFEGRGDRTRAEALLITYVELIKPLPAPEEATSALARLAAAGAPEAVRADAGDALEGARAPSAAVLPVRARVLERTANRVVVQFQSVSASAVAPWVHFRKPDGTWQELRMRRGERVRWEATVSLTEVDGGELDYWLQVRTQSFLDAETRAPFQLDLVDALAAR